jgi:hypothetical protein
MLRSEVRINYQQKTFRNFFMVEPGVGLSDNNIVIVATISVIKITEN